MDGISANTIVQAGGVVACVYLFLKYMGGKDKSQADRDKNATEAMNKLTSGINKLVESQQEVAEATNRAADEAKQRNGHLGELMLEAKTATGSQHKAILRAIKSIAVESKKERQNKNGK